MSENPFQPKRPARAVAESEASPSSPSGNGSANVLALPASVARPGGRRVFVCENNGVTVYADEPCDDRANSVFLDTKKTNVYDGAAATPPVVVNPTPMPQPQPQPSTQQGPQVVVVGREPAPPATKAMQCAQIQQELDRVDAIARLGHSSAEGERLRAERHRLTDMRYVAKCG